MTCGRILRRPGRLVVSKEELESTIAQLVRPGETNSGELRSVVLVNRDGKIAAAAPTNVDFPSGEVHSAPNWDGPIVWLPNLVDLGTNLTEDLIVLPREMLQSMRTNRPAGSGTNATASTNSTATNFAAVGTNARGSIATFGRGRGGRGCAGPNSSDPPS